MISRLSAVLRPALGLALATLVLIGYAGLAPQARADSAPADPTDPGTPVTATADALPTVQINGVVWSQAVVGNTVYVAGEFTRARPAGSPAGSNETVRNNLLAYDIRTGELITSFAPNLNAQAMVVAASPDGSRIYVGGDFDVANGQPRYSIAAYSTATGQLIDTFQPIVGSQVRAIAATNSTVYIGGYNFGVAGGAARGFLAAFNAADGKVTSWAPVVNNMVTALALVNNDTAVVIAGHMTSLNGTTVSGLGEVSATSGATLPFAASTLTGNGGTDSAFTALTTDTDTVYASAYAFQTGTNEGVLAINPSGGAVRWVDDCYGDSYSVWASGSATYVAGHPHYCGNTGGFDQNAPLDGAVNYYRAIAFSRSTMGRITPTTGYAVDRRGSGAMVGQPAPALLNWFPTIDAGTYTGQYQGPWSVTGTSQYVAYGGEFPAVNGTRQQGLVRFAVPGIAPNKVGPIPTGLTPTAVTSWAAGTARVSVQTTYDLDNGDLVYKLYRTDKPGVPVAQTVAHSTFYNRPTISLVDQSAPSGQRMTYFVTASDPAGNTVTGSSTSVTIGTSSTMGTAPDAYSRTVTADSPSDYWRFGEANGTKVYDQAGNNDLTLAAGAALNQPGPLPQNKAVSFSGTSTGTSATQTAVPGPNVFSLEGWFSTTSTSGGKLIGFGDAKTGLSGNNDRQLTLDGTGRVTFAVYNDASSTVQSAAGLNDGKWHYVVGTLNGSGMKLYVDGKPAGTKAGVTYGYPYSGYWRVGGDRTWDATNPYLAASVDEVAVYSVALSATQVAAHFAAAASGNTAPTASFTSTVEGLKVSVDASASADVDGTIASYAWDLGNGQTATGKTASVTYAAAGTYSLKLTVTDNAGATGTVTNSVTVTAPPAAGSALATDTFERTANGGWGAADLGGSWAIAGTASNATVTGGSGRLTAAAGSSTAASLGISARDVSLTADLSLDKAASGGGSYPSVGVRATDSTMYNAQLSFASDGSVGIDLVALANGTENYLAAAMLPTNYTAGSVLTLKLEAVGASPTTVRAKLWPSGTTEPTTWTVAATDTTAALQAAGGLHTELYASRTSTAAQTLRLDNLSVVAPGAAPANVAPTAGFTSSASNLALSVDASTSTDSDGTIASWAWDFGDGATGTGKTASHSYAAAGTYSVKLTVTDNTGATGTLTRTVQVAAPVNTPPTAAFTSSAANLALSVDASTSTDSDGTIASWAWDFGDGATGTGKTASHSYAAAGTYSVKLTVTDNAGATGTVTTSVAVTAPANKPPAAGFTSSAANLALSVDASTSTDADGTIASYAWDFGDGATGAGKTAAHTYAAAGTYSVKLTVTDNAGATGTLTRPVTVTAAPPANVAPTAAFTSTASNLTLAVDGSTSADSDGTIASWAWDFGDGATATGKTASHTYAAAGTYSVKLTVTDNAGATGTVTTSVAVTAPANKPPAAAFTSAAANLALAVDGSTSADSDGTIASWAWDFGDGATATGKTAAHTYAAAGTYSVKLTVTDNAGATGAVTRPVAVTATPTALARDAFARTTTSGWGSADLGGAWTVAGSAANATVASGTGRLTAAAGVTTGAALGISSRDVAFQADVILQKAPAGGASFIGLGTRNVGATRYNTQLYYGTDGSVTLSLVRVVNWAETELASYTLPGTFPAGTSLTVRMESSGSGSTTLGAKAWKTGTSEPSAWQVTATDTTAALQVAGGVYIELYNSSRATSAQTLQVDNLWAGAAGTKP
jgi:PKD repeat protein